MTTTVYNLLSGKELAVDAPTPLHAVVVAYATRGKPDHVTQDSPGLETLRKRHATIGKYTVSCGNWVANTGVRV